MILFCEIIAMSTPAKKRRVAFQMPLTDSDEYDYCKKYQIMLVALNIYKSVSPQIFR